MSCIGPTIRAVCQNRHSNYNHRLKMSRGPIKGVYLKGRQKGARMRGRATSHLSKKL